MFRADRRTMLKGAAAGGGLLATQVASAGQHDDAYWERIKAAYSAAPKFINLNNAGVSPQPLVVQEAMIRAYRFANELPDVHMWQVLDATRGRTRQKLARVVDCDPAEIALNRNSTEGLCTVINGLDFERGDEVILSDWDYESMRHSWRARARRHGISLRRVQFDLMGPDHAIIDAYQRAMTPRTKVLHLTHMIHYTGRVLPLEKLCQMARARGVRTLVDAAQTVGQVPLSFRRIGCDYLATSLHKWMCAPFGTGMLIVRRDRVDDLWPSFGPFYAAPEGIEKISGMNLGTYSSPAEHAIETAVDFHLEIGTDVVHRRLRELTRYWIERANDIRGFRVHTPLGDPQTAAVTLFSIEGQDPAVIEKRLLAEHGIRVRRRDYNGLAGIRVSPHIYTRKVELDRFVAALRTITRA